MGTGTLPVTIANEHGPSLAGRYARIHRWQPSAILRVNTTQYQQIEDLSRLLKSISHPIRLKILCLLQDQELTVGDLHREIRTTTANISQHLNILRNQGVIDFRKEANFIYNRISDQRIIELMKTMQTLFCTTDKQDREITS